MKESVLKSIDFNARLIEHDSVDFFTFARFLLDISASVCYINNMLPATSFSDREVQVIKVALQLMNNLLHERIEKGEPTKPINEYDILDQRHTLMHTLTALSKLTQLPVTSFQNPQQETGPTAS
jgi:hypothetical protein